MSIELPPGAYSIKWINPVTGTAMASGAKECSRGELTLETPRYMDIVLKIGRLPDTRSWSGRKRVQLNSR